ncbi:class II ATPase [Mitosporidium daphniae]|uniref:Class II ATPase n=1 Tax=Mitosporidium daphniae TaxID=1485682 RepID=A0A098VRN2_9MICR|nr:class II ATPase [Mitosporidium daphniae]KGG51630.1 class II ATPase [Mitosporidium daphniae]|eukprot:XP_013238113.1 class II ATPase [Mitosporidium daphniae]
MVSLYQGGIIIFLALWLFETDFIHIVAISFSALLFNELLMVALQLNEWNRFMILSEIFSVLCYVATVHALSGHFDPLFISSPTFLWKVSFITVVSFLPLLLIKVVQRVVSPPNYAKLS